MNKLYLSALLLLSYTVTQAQFNDSTHYYFKLLSTGIINTTNDAKSYVLKNGFNFNAQKKKMSYNTFFNWIYGELQNDLTNNDFTAHGDVDFNKGITKLYYWGLVNYDKIYSLNINYRLQAGAGIAYNIIDSPDLRINVSDGIVYEKGDLQDATIGRDVYQVPRNSFRLSYKWDIANRLRVDGIHFYQPSLLSIKDYVIQSSSNLSVKLNQWLSITAALTYNRVSRTNRENLLFTYGLTIEKYF